ncbi:MAG TPA: 1,2-phenylacetyl-CoA epoxidase subunit PaaD [Parvularculaceae bacterium]|nr:1,2-phenylacetyl-CoA epoxidase subunit PaaD [Parvularculaceae bacterium]
MTALATIYSIDEIWGWLADVPDPEIPVLSIVDLGIVRDVEWSGETLVVAVTPTYSGCPATAYIAAMIDAAIRARGIHDIKIETQLSPPWTTEWISKEGRKKLKAYGIAPPVEGAACAGAMKAPAEVACPHCGSTETEEVSRFGSTPCKASWRCKDCLEPFDYFKSF